MTEQAIKLIKKFEGKCLTPYVCPAGYRTIGWGHRLTSYDAFTLLTDAEADDLLRQDLRRCERALTRLVRVPLLGHQEAALLSFIFNVGAGAFQRSTLRMKVNRREHEEVPLEFHRWVWSKGKKLPGLVVRRAVEASWYEGAFT
jgi:lysozyme